MKKILFVGITALAMASCTHDDYAPVSKQEQYQAVFEKEFGAVNPNVNWGFTPQQVFTFDKDGKLIGTRGANTNANEWGGYVEVPEPLTEAQIQKVTTWFTNHPKPHGIAINWSDFFVQQVSSTEYGKNMDYLTCGTAEEHINNFNGGDGSTNNNVCYWQNPDDQNDKKYRSDKIQFMVNSSTECFGYYDSRGTYNKQYNDKFVIIPGSMIDSSVAGMYFVGFDYNSSKGEGSSENINADGYYNDWIVRIAPGLNAPGTAMRVMVEDIIDSDLKSVQTSDWDFNDAVFDVKFETSWVNGTPENNYQDGHNQKFAIITLHAAGGTKYLTIGGQGDKGVEVHKALCVEEQGTMINTGNGATRPVAIFRIPVAANMNNANDIPVYVGTQELKAQQGEATQKLCVPTDVKWMKERVQFINSYDKFKDYVNSNTPDNWYKSVKNLGNLY